MDIFFLKLYGLNIKISCDSDFASENLKKDFELYLGKDPDLDPDISLMIFKKTPPYDDIPRGIKASLYSMGSICYKANNTHYVDYYGRGLMIYNFEKEEARIYSEDENLLYEKAKLAILSRAGEFLDKKGMHRVHAMGLAKNDMAAICLLPMAAGKTTLALGALRKGKDIKLISDDVCVIDMKGYVSSLVLRVGSRDIPGYIPAEYITMIERDFYGRKYLIDMGYFKGRIAERSKLRNILIGKRVFQDQTRIRKIAKVKCFTPFIQSGVFGLGLPQVVELFLRGDFQDILGKIKMLFSRSVLFLTVILRTDTYEIEIGRDIEKCLDELIRFINYNAR
jgi:hypothetical protein